MFTKKHKELIDELQELCPTAFPKKPLPKIPLEHKVHLGIKEVLGCNHATARSIVFFWTQGHRYDRAIVFGEPTYDVYGNVVGKVSEGQARVHKERLDAYYASRVAPKGYVVGQCKPMTFAEKLWKLLGVASVFNSPKEQCHMSKNKEGIQ
jgi:sRNA-binding protein